MFRFYQRKPAAVSMRALMSLLVFSSIVSCSKREMNLPLQSQTKDLVSESRIRAAVAPAKQTARSGVYVSPKINGFYEYLPKGYANDSTKSYPLLICMHGVGQIGNGTTDLPGLLTYGPAMMINNGTFPTSFTVDGKSYSMIIITPQLNDLGMFPTDIDAMIEYCKTNYRVDASRVYLAGVSYGGAQTWHYAGFSAATAAKVAAIVPICAWTTPEYGFQFTQQEAQNVATANVKIWQAHCYNDPTAMFSWSVNEANMVRNANPKPATDPKLTSFNSDSHDAWTTTYDPAYKEGGMNIYQWMLHYAKGVNATPLPLKVPFTQMVTIKGSNNMYIHNNADGVSAVNCSSPTYAKCEGFVVSQVSGNKVSLLNQGCYLSKANASSISCNATAVTGAETFLWIFNSDGTVSFRGNNNKYLSNNNGVVNCLASAIGPNEKFRINQ